MKETHIWGFSRYTRARQLFRSNGPEKKWELYYIL